MKKIIFSICILLLSISDIQGGLVKFARLKDYEVFKLEGKCEKYDSEDLSRKEDEGTLKIWVEKYDLRLILKSDQHKSDLNITFPLKYVNVNNYNLDQNNGKKINLTEFRYGNNAICIGILFGPFFVIKYNGKLYDITAPFMKYIDFEGNLIKADNGSDYQTSETVSKWFTELQKAIEEGKFKPQPVYDLKPEY